MVCSNEMGGDLRMWENPEHCEWREPAKGQSYLHPALSVKSLALTLFPYPREVTAVRCITQLTSVPFGGMLTYLARDHAKIIQDKVVESPPSAKENTPKD